MGEGRTELDPNSNDILLKLYTLLSDSQHARLHPDHILDLNNEFSQIVLH